MNLNLDGLWNLIKDDKFMIWAFRIVFGVIALFIVWQLISFEISADKGKHVKLLGFERNIPKPDTVFIKKTDTIYRTRTINKPNNVKNYYESDKDNNGTIIQK